MFEQTALLIWDYIKDYFNKQNVEVAASKFLDALYESGYTDEQVKSLRGHDDDLDVAIDYCLEDDDMEFMIDDDIDD